MRITSTFLVDSSNSKLHLKDPSLMTKLKAAMATESFTSVNMFDEMLEDVVVDLKRLKQDFCWSLKSKTVTMGDYEVIFKNPEENDFFANLTKHEPSLLGPYYFCQSILEFRRILKKKTDIVKTALNIGVKFLAIQSNFYTGNSQIYDMSNFTEEIHMEQVKTRLRLGAYSVRMFDTLYEYVKRPLILFNMDLIVQKRK